MASSQGYRDGVELALPDGREINRPTLGRLGGHLLTMPFAELGIGQETDGEEDN